MRARGALGFLFVLLAACASHHRREEGKNWCGFPPPPPPRSPDATSCRSPPPPRSFPLSVVARASLGERPRLRPLCDRLAVETRASGLRLFDPETRRFVAAVRAENEYRGFGLLVDGALAIWTDDRIDALDRLTLATAWSRPRAGRGRVFVTDNFIVEEAGHACDPDCRIVGYDGADGARLFSRRCPCDDERKKLPGPPEVYEDIVALNAGFVATRVERGVEAWPANDMPPTWDRPEHATITDRFVVVDGSTKVDVLGGDGNFVMTLDVKPPQVETVVAAGYEVFVASSAVDEYGGVTPVAVTAFDAQTKQAIWRTELGKVARPYSPPLPRLWPVHDGPLYVYDPGTGFLTTIDRKNGQTASTIGVAGGTLERTTNGFAVVDDEDVVTFLEPTANETPPRAKIVVEGSFRLSGKPLPSTEIVVGNVATKTRADGRFSATLEARGAFWVRAKQPTTARSTAAWAHAEARIEVDDRTTYQVDIDAVPDTLD